MPRQLRKQHVLPVWQESNTKSGMTVVMPLSREMRGRVEESFENPLQLKNADTIIEPEFHWEVSCVKIMKKHQSSMLEGPLLSSIIFYTIPIIMTSVLQLLFNAADLIVVGRFCGSVSVGAVGATGSLTALMVNLFVGLSIGAGVAVAHGIGSRDEEQVSNAVHTALPLALLGGAILTAIGLLFSEPLLMLMGTPENTLPLSVVYMKIYFCGITFTVVYNFCAAILRAAGDTRSPLIFLTIAGVVNVILNVVFVTLLHMNVAGVALATTISQAIAAVLVVRALMKRTDACRLQLRKMRFYKHQLIKIVRIGLPAGIQSSLFSISNVLIQSSINSFGDIFVSGNAAATNLENFLYVSLNSFHQTTVNFVGQNVGARQYRRANNTVWICQSCVLVVGIAMGTAIWAFGEQLLGIYISDSPEAIQYGMIRFVYVTLPYFVLGLLDVSTGALRGYGKSLTPMIISVLGICGIRVMWIFTVFQLPAFHNPKWLYLSYPISWVVTLVVQMIFFFRVRGEYLVKDKNIA